MVQIIIPERLFQVPMVDQARRLSRDWMYLLRETVGGANAGLQAEGLAEFRAETAEDLRSRVPEAFEALRAAPSETDLELALLLVSLLAFTGGLSSDVEALRVELQAIRQEGLRHEVDGLREELAAIQGRCAEIVQDLAAGTAAFEDAGAEAALAAVPDSAPVEHEHTASDVGAPEVVSTLALSGQTGNLAATNLQQDGATLPAGLYAVHLGLAMTPTGAATVDATMGWSDPRAGAKTWGTSITGAAVMCAIGPSVAPFNVVLDGSADLTVTVTVTGTATWDLEVAVERLLAL